MKVFSLMLHWHPRLSFSLAHVEVLKKKHSPKDIASPFLHGSLAKLE